VGISEHKYEAVISVRDTGLGIPADKLPHIFDRFYQVDSSTTRSAEGTGIGLSLVKDFVDLHHGTIGVTSEPGRGTMFTVRLRLGTSHLAPAEIVPESPAPPEPVEVPFDANNGYGESSPTPGADDSGQPIILVVEDNADVRDYIRSCLSGSYSVTEANDGLA